MYCFPFPGKNKVFILIKLTTKSTLSWYHVFFTNEGLLTESRIKHQKINSQVKYMIEEPWKHRYGTSSIFLFPFMLFQKLLHWIILNCFSMCCQVVLWFTSMSKTSTRKCASQCQSFSSHFSEIDSLLFMQGECSSVNSVSTVRISLSLSQFGSFLKIANNSESSSFFVLLMTSLWGDAFPFEVEGFFTELRVRDINVRVVLTLPVQSVVCRCQTFLNSACTSAFRKQNNMARMNPWNELKNNSIHHRMKYAMEVSSI